MIIVVKSKKIKAKMSEKLFVSLGNSVDSEQVINNLIYQLVNFLIYSPTKLLQQAVIDDHIYRLNLLKN